MDKFWVISDIHGCLSTLRSLIETQIVPSKSDTLCFLGDYIDRGPESKGVMDYIMDLQMQHNKIIALKGNHEEFLVKAWEEEQNLRKFLFFKESNKSKESWLKYGGEEAMESFNASSMNQIPQFYIDWINQRPLYYEHEKFFIVHAGLNFQIEDPLEDKQAMLWIRDYIIDPAKINNKRLLHGHVPVSLDFIDLTINSDSYPFIDLDNGCYMAHKAGYGNLLALELESLQLKIQPNIDVD